jgi:hypothetical protein
MCINGFEDWYGLLGDPKLDMRANPRSAPFTRELAYVCTGAPQEVVLLSGVGPSFPPGISVFAPRLVESTRVMPGDSLRWSVRLPLPVPEWHAYSYPEPGQTRPVEATRVRFRLETLRESCTKQPVTEYVNFPGIFKARGARCVFHEATAQLTEPITVLQRTDTFERFG